MVTSRKAAVLFVLTSCLLPVFSHAADDAHERDADKDRGVQVGPRPFYLIDKMSPGPLKRKLEQRSEEHTSELQSQSNLVCRLLLEKKKMLTILAAMLGNQMIVLSGGGGFGAS